MWLFLAGYVYGFLALEPCDGQSIINRGTFEFFCLQIKYVCGYNFMMFYSIIYTYWVEVVIKVAMLIYHLTGG